MLQQDFWEPTPLLHRLCFVGVHSEAWLQTHSNFHSLANIGYQSWVTDTLTAIAGASSATLSYRRSCLLSRHLRQATAKDSQRPIGWDSVIILHHTLEYEELYIWMMPWEPASTSQELCWLSHTPLSSVFHFTIQRWIRFDHIPTCFTSQHFYTSIIQ